MSGIPLAPRGIPQIEVKFDIDANGIVSVSAKDLGTGKSQAITIQEGSGLSDEEIERMIKEAEENAAADQKRKEEADLRNECDQLIFGAKKSLDELGDEATEDEKKAVEEKSEALKKALEGNDIEEIKKMKEDLEKAAQSIAIKAYEKIQKAQQEKAQENKDGGNKSNDDGDTVEADFEEK